MPAAPKEQTVPAPEPPTEVLVFPDGDRTSGKLIGRDGEFLIFQSVRFGELRVRASEAQVVSVEDAEVAAGRARPQTTEGAPVPPLAPPLPVRTPPPAAVVTEDGATGTVEMPGRGRPRWTSPAALALALREFLGPWEGRFALSASVLTNSSENRDLAAELRFLRRWEHDEARVTFNYDLSETNEVTDTDLLKSAGLLRHDFQRPFFVNYRPLAEWNRAFTTSGSDSDYLLVQQEIGLGVNLVNHDDRKIRLGVAENVFDVWTFADDSHTTRDNQSLFTELELRLPWRITLNDRLVWYYSLQSREEGWEHRFDLNKKFTDALSLGVRHELRRNNPDARVEDYTLWRFLIGLDF